MTIAISLKVNEGIVLAADSASTLVSSSQGGVLQVFNNANKVFNLRKGLPIGLITWSSGSIGHAAISTLAKDLRLRLTRPGPEHGEWHLEAQAYQLEEVATLVRRFMFEEHYSRAFADWVKKPPLGFILAGYSAGRDMAEEYSIQINERGECPDPEPIRSPESVGVTWNGEPEAISRLVLGFSPKLGQTFEQRLSVPPEQIPQALQILQNELAAQVIYDAMPIQDAIDLAEFLVDLTERFSSFTPGAPTVGGPIEIAAITKHEGFKWVKRKYYFSKEFNPKD